jgi:hypothetical protein
MPLSDLFSDLYKRHWPAFFQYHQSRNDLSPPLLVNPLDNYTCQTTRLFVVGQETKTWYNTEPMTIVRLMTIYKDEFKLGMACGKHRRGAFWRFIRCLEQGLGIAKGAMVWSNLNKVDQNGGRPDDDVRDDIFNTFPVLPVEIRLAAPDVVIFLTGWGYDKFLQQTVFPGAQFDAVDGGNGRRLARVVRQGLPTRSFRTYHPSYLQRSGKWAEVRDLLVKLCK